MKRSIRGTVLFLTIALAISASMPSRAKDDEPGCVYRVSVYVKTADAMLEDDLRPKSRYSLEPYIALNKGALFEGCTLQEVKAEISKSKFVQPFENTRRDRWIFALSNGRIEIGFSYLADEKKSRLHYHVWTKKSWPDRE